MNTCIPCKWLGKCYGFKRGRTISRILYPELWGDTSCVAFEIGKEIPELDKILGLGFNFD